MAINRTDMATKYLAPIDEAELAVRIVEANYQMRRPAGFTARQALDAMDPDARAAIQRCPRRDGILARMHRVDAADKLKRLKGQ